MAQASRTGPRFVPYTHPDSVSHDAEPLTPEVREFAEPPLALARSPSRRDHRPEPSPARTQSRRDHRSEPPAYHDPDTDKAHANARSWSPPSCVVCKSPLDDRDDYVNLGCGADCGHAIHIACITCPHAECAPATIKSTAPSRPAGLWPLTDLCPVTSADVDGFVERNRAALTRHPVFPHPSGTTTAQSLTTVQQL